MTDYEKALDVLTKRQKCGEIGDFPFCEQFKLCKGCPYETDVDFENEADALAIKALERYIEADKKIEDMKAITHVIVNSGDDYESDLLNFIKEQAELPNKTFGKALVSSIMHNLMQGDCRVTGYAKSDKDSKCWVEYTWWENKKQEE